MTNDITYDVKRSKVQQDSRLRLPAGVTYAEFVTKRMVARGYKLVHSDNENLYFTMAASLRRELSRGRPDWQK